MAIKMDQPAREALKPWLNLVQQNATRTWQEDLKSLFLEARNWYPDVVWEISATPNNEEGGQLARQVWGHQAIIRARAHPRFHALYLPDSAETWPSNALTFRRFEIPGDLDHESFLEDLQFLYTAGSSPASLALHPLDQLQEDLISMSKGRLSTDVVIYALVESTNVLERITDAATLAEFYSHRFMLSLRSSYFRNLIADLIGRDTYDPNKPLLLPLPFPLFTAASFYSILGYIYSGSLTKSPDHQYNLSTAFAIYRGSLHLGLPALEELMLAEIAVEMLHGLFHAPLSDITYTKLVSGKWTNMVELGCRCNECAHRAPLALQFALEDDIKNEILERGARRALVGLFGEGWYSEELSALPTNITDSIIANVQEIITPPNALPLLFAAENALLIHDTYRKYWHTPIRAMIIAIRNSVEQLLCTHPRDCFKTQEWKDIVNRPDTDVRFRKKDGSDRQVSWIMQTILRGSNQGNWFAIYEALPQPKTRSTESTLLGSNTRIRAQIDRAKLELFEIMTSEVPPSLPIQEPDNSRITQIPEMIEDPIYTASGIFGTGALQFSLVSLPSVAYTVDSAFERATDASYNFAISALDLANTISLYSSASSRTVSTDYGIYYTRRAVSQETIQDRDAGHSITRRRSYDSFWAQALA